ncbi:MAG TPA: TonB-dependent receptor plug domain-containing protein [Kofleriaceae bacterium]
MKRFLALAVLLASAAAHAQGVDVADLPPLPATDEEVPSSATVLAASTADEDVVSGAAKREQSLGNVASAVTVITADRIRRFGYRNISEAIVGVAGVYIQANRLTDQVGIRGLQIEGGFNSRLLVLVDGATINENWGAFAGVGFDGLIPIDEVQRIEVIRGPVGALYGTNAFVAIINVVTKSAADGKGEWGRLGVNSIYGATAAAGFAQGSINRQIRGVISFVQRFGESGIPSVPEIAAADGTDKLSSDRGQSITASVVGRYDGSFGQIRAYRVRRDSPFAPYNADPSVDQAYALYNYQLLAEGGHTAELTKDFVGTVRAYGNLYRFYDEINYTDPPQFVDYGDVATIGAEARGRYQLIEKKLGLTGGVEVNYNRTRSLSYYIGDTQTPVPVNYGTEGVYAEFDGQPTEWLGFTAGARFDNNTHVDSRVSPRAALFINKNEQYGLKLLYAEGFRNPSTFEKDFRDCTTFIDNPDTKSETIRSFEGVVWGRPLPGLSLRGSAFYWDTNKIIEQIPHDLTAADIGRCAASGFDPSMVPGNLLQFVNHGKYRTYGGEVEGTYRSRSGWYAYGGGGVQRVGFGAFENNTQASIQYGKVTDAPKITATAGVSTPKLGDLAHVSAEMQYVGRRATRMALLYQNDTMMSEEPGLAQYSDAWVGINGVVYFPNVRGFDVTAGVRNILGTRDLMPAPGDYDVAVDANGTDPATTKRVPRIPGEGREFYLKVGYTF